MYSAIFAALASSVTVAAAQPETTPGCNDREKGLVRIRTQLIHNEEGRVTQTKNGTGFVTAVDGVVRVVTAAHVVSADPPNSPTYRAESAVAWGCTPTDWRPVDVLSSGFHDGKEIDLAVLSFRSTAPGGMTPIEPAIPAGFDGVFSLWGYPAPERDSSGHPEVVVISPATLEERMTVDKNFPAGISGSPFISTQTGRAVGVAVNRSLNGVGSSVLMFVARNSWLLEHGLGVQIRKDSARDARPLAIDVSYNSFADANEAIRKGEPVEEPPEIWFSLTNTTASAMTVTQIRLTKSTRSVFKSLPTESDGTEDAIIDLGAHAIKGPNVNLNPDRTFRLDGRRLQGFRVALDAESVAAAVSATKRSLGVISGFRNFANESACDDLGRRVEASDLGDWRLIIRYVDAAGRGASALARVYDYPLAKDLQPILGSSCSITRSAD